MLNNYLNNNLKKLDKNKIKRIREHTYYLISSSISYLYKNDKKIIPNKDDLILKELFLSAKRLNTLGANLAYYQLFQMKSTDQYKSINFTKNFRLSLKHDLFKLEHKYWSVKFPYYFMIRKISESKINDTNTTIVAISTGGSKDKSKFGYSQSSITLLVSDKYNDKEFFKHWYKAFEISSDSKLTNIGVKDYKTQYRYDKKHLMNSEIVSWSTNFNSFIVMFDGLDGTFQDNREHFLNFINSIIFK